MNAAQPTMPSVLFLALDTYSQIGGIQRFNRRVISALTELAARQRAPMPRVHIMRDTAEDIPHEAGATIVGFGPNRIGFLQATVAALREIDLLILGHINLLPVAALCRMLRPRLKVMLFVHGDEAWDDRNYRKKPYEPLLLKAVDRIASASAWTAGRMSQAFSVPAEKYRVFPNAVDPIPATEAIQRRRTAITVARLDWHDRGKNIDAVIGALALLRERGVEARLEIIGDGPIRAELEQLTRQLDLTDGVAFLGRVTDAELAAAYERAAVFVMPSSKEGFGIVYLEAWQHGLPVICGTEDAAHEIVGDGEDGYAVNPSDVPLLAERIAYLLDNPDIAAGMGRLGARKVAERYTMACFRQNLEALIEGIA